MSSTDKILKRKFEILFREHFTVLCYFARKYTGDLDASKEIVHSVFVTIWENRSEFNWDKPAKSYLFTSVYNRSLNYIRDNKKFINGDVSALQQMAKENSSYSDNIELAELTDSVKSAIQRLPEKCREIFELSRFKDMKYSEIADYLNISIKTVETQMSRALVKLREDLKEYLTILLIFILKNMHNW